MARLGTYSVRVGTEEKNKFRKIDFVVNVNVDGEFTTTLDADLASELEQAGVKLQRNRRRDREGYFYDKTKDGLCVQILECYKEMYSRELISETKVLQYSMLTTASFCFTVDGEIIPNGSWSEDGKFDEVRHWQNGTKLTHAASPFPIGVQMFIKPLYKRVYLYNSGKELTEYEGVDGVWHHTKLKEDKSDYYWMWLANIVSTIPPKGGKIREIEYTEKRAKFFVELYKKVCQMAAIVAKFEEPEAMAKIADSGKLLLE
tara:strand:- start:19575 stop:20351 length:777 start_codon:yes stop_codon:yes gene_type:complete